MHFLRRFSILAFIVLSFLIASSAFANEHQESASYLAQLKWPIANFLITVSLLTLLYKKVLSALLSNHRSEVETALETAQTALTSAKKELDIATEQLANVKSEASNILAEQTSLGQKLADSVIKSANEAAETLESETNKRITEELKRAESEVRKMLVTAAIKEVERGLKEQITPDTDRQYRDQALNSL